jgi:hypothetical protein
LTAPRPKGEHRAMEITRHPDTPAEVDPTKPPREPESDPTLGLEVPPPRGADPKHRLVTVGDSLTHGFQSGAIFNTGLSYPTIIARELGVLDRFTYPSYEGHGGLPLNLEYLLRRLEESYGSSINVLEALRLPFRVRQLMAEIEDWWERGPGSRPPNVRGFLHNTGIYGWDLNDAMERTSKSIAAEIDEPTDALFVQLVQDANERAALRVLQPAENVDGVSRSQVDVARAIGDDGGIETLIVMLGANNALGSVVSLKVRWTEDEHFADPVRKRRYTVWRPSHFKQELERLATQVARIKARHVIWATVPHVTIAPVARGVARKVAPGSRFFPYYTRPWISDEEFDERHDPCIDERQARDVDSAIDQYNEAIVDMVRSARSGRPKRDWYVLELAGVLDRLAHRRYVLDPTARPPWWTKYELPPELAALAPPPDSRFFASDEDGRKAGGLFSLDGVHPTTIGYGLMAQEAINVMRRAGVGFRYPNGAPRPDPVRVNFNRLIREDTLISNPPTSLTSDLRLIGRIDELLDVFSRLLRGGAGTDAR